MSNVHGELHSGVRGFLDQRIEVDADYVNGGRGADG
jgi:hypothetical protein